MLEKLRKFSNSIFAKIFLFIVAIPFVFWGMGDLFSGGNKKTIAQIGDEKISTQEFVNYVNARSSNVQIDDKVLESLLGSFIGEKLIEQEINNYNIKLSDLSLAKIIKNQKIFKKDNEFSRTEYEKFLIQNGLNNIVFEKNLSKQEEKNQLLNFVSGGILPSEFITNFEYNKINQEREIRLINLNNILKNKFLLSDEEIKKYFENNKNSYSVIYKTIEYLKLNPKTLTGKDEYSDLFFKKIDNIDDLIVEGGNLQNISKELELGKIKNLTFDSSGKNKNLENVILSKELIIKVFNITASEPVILVEDKENYFLIELVNSESLAASLDDNKVKKLVVNDLKNKVKRNYISDLINKINNKDLSIDDFNKISKNNNVQIQTILINNINDEDKLKKNLISQIYLYPKKRVIIITDIGLEENYLVYTNKIKNVFIQKNSDEYKKYNTISKAKMKNLFYSTYEIYLRQKYKVDINYSVLENVKNYF